MEVTLRDGTIMSIEPYVHSDFTDIQKLNEVEGWHTLSRNCRKTRIAWENSTIAFIVRAQHNEIVGFIRGHTDTAVSLFICELLIDKRYRGLGIGTTLLQYVHDMYPDTRVELLATSGSQTYYENLGYRPFYGFRKTYQE
ncbi:GNAT family N-acetyltransferase [Sporosarcina gallistercoris]|uniref:GNAT family N-acetyltransferase n=1 Tax=Sporosarcina gallistercoris TaxID=2762245 RepID=A0ABR8PIX3_9BACL|nr:GNAT family N-acetyltransferase [Sporosarcina gallistercoris]MBD7908115.1 GNAT family N-acetyltransferase [Sporosarcina gallistercoris]